MSCGGVFVLRPTLPAASTVTSPNLFTQTHTHTCVSPLSNSLPPPSHGNLNLYPLPCPSAMHNAHDNDPTSSGEESDGLSGGDNGGGGGNVDKKRRRLELNRKVRFWCGRVDVRGVFSPFFFGAQSGYCCFGCLSAFYCRSHIRFDDGINYATVFAWP